MLTAAEIRAACQAKDIEISPFNEDMVKANSYDVRLSRRLLKSVDALIDPKQPLGVQEIFIPSHGFILEPGQFYLGVTREWTYTPKHVAMVEGRSTMARYNLVIHQAAGFGDVGFRGHWTLELTVTKAMRVYPDMRVGQISFVRVTEGTSDADRGSVYAGGYNNEFSEDPTPLLPRAGNI